MHTSVVAMAPSEMVVLTTLSVALRILYATFCVVLLYWFSFDALNWFGFEKHNSNTEIVSFNWHALFMSLAVLVFMSEAVIAFKTMRNTCGVSHATTKAWHAACHMTALCLFVAGLSIIFTNHAQKEIKHLYSAHSWLGIGVASFMALQGVQGIVVFYTGMDSATRAAFLPVHKYFGLVIYFLSCAVICMGLQEKTSFLGNLPQCKPDVYCSEIQLANVLALLVVMIAAVTGSLVYTIGGEPSDNTPLLAELRSE